MSIFETTPRKKRYATASMLRRSNQIGSPLLDHPTRSSNLILSSQSTSSIPASSNTSDESGSDLEAEANGVTPLGTTGFRQLISQCVAQAGIDELQDEPLFHI
jgi:hypothetical protein